MFGIALLRREGVRGFGFGVGCSGVIQMIRDGRRQVGIGRIGVGSVTVVTPRQIINNPTSAKRLENGPLVAGEGRATQTSLRVQLRAMKGIGDEIQELHSRIEQGER